MKDLSIPPPSLNETFRDTPPSSQVVEEQLQLERARESELDVLYTEEAVRQWEKRENQWRREAAAREHLMKEVLEGEKAVFECDGCSIA